MHTYTHTYANTYITTSHICSVRTVIRDTNHILCAVPQSQNWKWTILTGKYLLKKNWQFHTHTCIMLTAWSSLPQWVGDFSPDHFPRTHHLKLEKRSPHHPQNGCTYTHTSSYNSLKPTVSGNSCLIYQMQEAFLCRSSTSAALYMYYSAIVSYYITSKHLFTAGLGVYAPHDLIT